jgi:hypothetical protein
VASGLSSSETQLKKEASSDAESGHSSSDIQLKKEGSRDAESRLAGSATLS